MVDEGNMFTSDDEEAQLIKAFLSWRQAMIAVEANILFQGKTQVLLLEYNEVQLM